HRWSFASLRGVIPGLNPCGLGEVPQRETLSSGAPAAGRPGDCGCAHRNRDHRFCGLWNRRVTDYSHIHHVWGDSPGYCCPIRLPLASQILMAGLCQAAVHLTDSVAAPHRLSPGGERVAAHAGSLFRVARVSERFLLAGGAGTRAAEGLIVWSVVQL